MRDEAGDDGEDLTALWAEMARPAAGHVETRRQREARSMSPSTRRTARRSETKTVQLNIRITPSLKKRLVALASARGVPVVEVIESAIAAMEGA
jgi:predicted HicB family RNase H-like nuclease